MLIRRLANPPNDVPRWMPTGVQSGELRNLTNQNVHVAWTTDERRSKILHRMETSHWYKRLPEPWPEISREEVSRPMWHQMRVPENLRSAATFAVVSGPPGGSPSARGGVA